MDNIPSLADVNLVNQEVIQLVGSFQKNNDVVKIDKFIYITFHKLVVYDVTLPRAGMRQ